MEGVVLLAVGIVAALLFVVLAVFNSRAPRRPQPPALPAPMPLRRSRSRIALRPRLSTVDEQPEELEGLEEPEALEQGLDAPHGPLSLA